MTSKPVKHSHSFTDKKKETFLALVARGYTVTDSAKQIGFSRRAVYNHRDRDPDFAQAWNEAREEGKERLEAECRRRAMGWAETRYDKDGNAYEVYRYSDNLLMFMLKKLDPSYRDSVNVNVTQERRIIVDLLPVVKDEVTGKLVLADGDVPLLSAGE